MTQFKWWDLYLQLTFWSILGFMAREGLTKLTFYTNSYINPNYLLGGSCIWSNFTASLVISFLNNYNLPWKVLMFEEKVPNKKALVLYLALTTGFAGSFSSFSTLVLEILAKTIDVLNTTQKLPNHGYGVMEFFSVIFTQMGVSMIGYHLGTDLASVLTRYAGDLGFDHPKCRRWVRKLELVTMVLGVLAWIANLVLSCTLHNRHFWKASWSFGIVFSPFACFARYHLSKLNARSWFPIGTFLTNVSASIVLAVLNVLIHGATKSGHRIITNQLQLDVLVALGSGFCGTYSTLSTFVNEIVGLKDEVQRAIYYFASLVVSFLTMLLILGCYSWTNGLKVSS
ncbi:hypothetical protein OGAPHI_001372 [Ogataea philodendri]|uniref:Fluoride export protein 1 n=1 Tax=Ogataea philodendri TaxID=1378263 RepID=A0A9P8PCG1_9ASCO|nr:uncharacterized protein OGAPHI_001372 [Ogataea philodendri]KAH3669251.1 hypothetical protein OGAPHI_001372 [Ogataea philodendri]